MQFIGVDLGGWSGNNTRVAFCRELNDKLILEEIKKELKNSDYLKKDNMLIKMLKDGIKECAIIGIDAPLSIPSVYKIKEPLYKVGGNSINNQYLYDNTDRFVYEHTKILPLAPTASYIGAITARAEHLIDKYRDFLNPIFSPKLSNEKINTIEVYPKVMLDLILQRKISYKKANWKKEKDGLIEQISKYVELNYIIESEDDFDSVLCALSCYYAYKDKYIKPKEFCYFTNRFIFIPKEK